MSSLGLEAITTHTGRSQQHLALRCYFVDQNPGCPYPTRSWPTINKVNEHLKNVHGKKDPAPGVRHITQKQLDAVKGVTDVHRTKSPIEKWYRIRAALLDLPDPTPVDYTQPLYAPTHLQMKYMADEIGVLSLAQLNGAPAELFETAFQLAISRGRWSSLCDMESAREEMLRSFAMFPDILDAARCAAYLPSSPSSRCPPNLLSQSSMTSAGTQTISDPVSQDLAQIGPADISMPPYPPDEHLQTQVQPSFPRTPSLPQSLKPEPSFITSQIYIPSTYSPGVDSSPYSF